FDPRYARDINVNGVVETIPALVEFAHEDVPEGAIQATRNLETGKVTYHIAPLSGGAEKKHIQEAQKEFKASSTVETTPITTTTDVSLPEFNVEGFVKDGADYISQRIVFHKGYQQYSEDDTGADIERFDFSAGIRFKEDDLAVQMYDIPLVDHRAKGYLGVSEVTVGLTTFNNSILPHGDIVLQPVLSIAAKEKLDFIATEGDLKGMNIGIPTDNPMAAIEKHLPENKFHAVTEIQNPSTANLNPVVDILTGTNEQIFMPRTLAAYDYAINLLEAPVVGYGENEAPRIITLKDLQDKLEGIGGYVRTEGKKGAEERFIEHDTGKTEVIELSPAGYDFIEGFTRDKYLVIKTSGRQYFVTLEYIGANDLKDVKDNRVSRYNAEGDIVETIYLNKDRSKMEVESGNGIYRFADFVKGLRNRIAKLTKAEDVFNGEEVIVVKREDIDSSGNTYKTSVEAFRKVNGRVVWSQDAGHTTYFSYREDGKLLFTNTVLRNFQENVAHKIVYYVTPDQDYISEIIGTKDAQLSLPEDNMRLGDYDYITFTAYTEQGRAAFDNIELHVTDQVGKTAIVKSRIADKKTYFANIGNVQQTKIIPFSYPSIHHDIQYPASNNVERNIRVVADFESITPQENIFVASVQWIKDLGLDTSNIKDIRVFYTGRKEAEIKISGLTLLGGKSEKLKQRDVSELIPEITALITDAAIDVNSNGTVTFAKGWNVKRGVVTDSYSIRLDGQLLSKKSLREGKTPITTIYEFDASNKSSSPAVNLYSGYPRYTTAEVVKNYKNGTNRSYYQPSNFALPWMEAYHLNKVDNVYTTIYGGQVVIPARYGDDNLAKVRKLTGNNVYMVFARNILGISDPNYQYNEKDAHVAEIMQKAKWQRAYLQEQEYPVAKLQHTFEWNELLTEARKPQEIRAERFIESIENIRNANTGLIPT
ncbi:MAG: hypothetical protein KC684_07265, partial [Candidatus Omnitrophica bacterium]|nr:hypothetical protein [Candidatus Omnitrophota bacterium]